MFKSEWGPAENQELCASSMLSRQENKEFIQEKLGGSREKATTFPVLENLGRSASPNLGPDWHSKIVLLGDVTK